MYVIADGHPAHKAKCVKEFVDSMNKQLELFILPRCSPGLNPDELVWNDIKTNALARIGHHTKEEMKKVDMKCLRALQETPEKVRGFFKTPSTSCAALSIYCLYNADPIGKLRRRE